MSVLNGILGLSFSYLTPHHFVIFCLSLNFILKLTSMYAFNWHLFKAIYFLCSVDMENSSKALVVGLKDSAYLKL